MKKRKGFVTNSSSSSFIIIGKSVDLQNIDLSKGKHVAFGDYLCDGQDIFEITVDMLTVLPYLNYDFTYCLVEKELYEPDGDMVSLNGEFNIWAGEVDYHTTEDVDSLIEKYKFDKKHLVNLLRKGEIEVDDFLRLSNYENS